MIRAATERDLPAIADIYRPYVQQTAYTFEYEVPSPEAFLERFRSVTQEHPWLVWEENGELLGYAYGERAFERAAYRWAADLAIYLRQDCRGRGIGRALYTELEELLRRQGYFVAYGLVTTANHQSRAFHQAMGYRQTAELPAAGGKLGQWHGVIWYEKRLREGDPETPPVPLREISARSSVF